MKILIMTLSLILASILGASVVPEQPTDSEFIAFKVYHHAVYMQTTAEQAGGTNKLLHTTRLPTEGTDAVVSPALDHIYSKAIIDLTNGPVVVEFPKIDKGRYYSIHITDQEHYTIYDEIHPVGKYVFVRKGKKMAVSEGEKVIVSPGDYPHLFIRIQVKTPDDLANVFPIHHAYYGPYFTNCKDEVLNGSKVEVFVFAYKPKGIELFWSVTRYSALTRNTIAGKNDLFNAYNTTPDANGNITVTFSINNPKDGTYWMPVNKDEPYYFVVRYYKPDIAKLPPKPCK
ncbi:MAG: hypothetical protein COB99_01825 [Sulfurimonas sp.]|nr:MAG: hypothetical protein COB99_01825 [Sulfurimonas sp.]